MFEVVMPQFGETETGGTVSRWLKNTGDTVGAEDPIVEISTDKVETEIPAQTGDTLFEICVPEGEEVEVGTILAVIE